MPLSADTVAVHKYIIRRGKRLTIKNRKYILRRPLVEVTEENVQVLQFLDCLKDVDRCAEEALDVCGQILTKYAMEHEISKSLIDRFIANYPIKIYKAMYETGVKYVSA